MKRQQVSASALKRLNKEIKRTRYLEARAANVDAARRALAMRRAANFSVYPAAGDTANEGMNPRPSRRRMTSVPGKRIGSISASDESRTGQARFQKLTLTELWSVAPLCRSGHVLIGRDLTRPIVRQATGRKNRQQRQACHDQQADLQRAQPALRC